MCGIAGVVYRDSGVVPDEGALRRMANVLVHRGPDGEGFHSAPGIGLAHRRLAVIDPRGSPQPMTNETGSVHVVFNGEIYDYRELRRELEDRGHHLATKGDTEVLVHLFEDEGPGLLSSLNGMFAFALWDADQRALLLARDRLGIKPLYYALDGEKLLFASEIKAILAFGFPARVNAGALPRHLAYNTLYGEETLFEGVRALLPGHTLLFRPGCCEPEIRRYWDLPRDELGAGLEETDIEEATSRLEDLLSASIRRRLVADVPVGVFLSGGLDSSLLVALAAREAGGPVRTFSIGFPEESGNEFLYSREVARRFGTVHEEILLEEDRFLDALPSLVWHNDEPIKHNNSIPLYFLSRATRGKATVILTGEGSDELFLGYRRYSVGRWQARLSALTRGLLPGGVARSLAALGPRLSRRKWATRLWGKAALEPRLLAATSSAVLDRDLYRRLVRIPGPEELDQPFLSTSFLEGDGDFLRRFSRMDLKAYLVSLLMKQDKMSMAASIESRVPFLDHELVEWAYPLPSSWKLRGGEGKWILKRLARRHLPEEIVKRRKLGFPVPAFEWVTRGAFRERAREILLDRKTLERGIVDPRGLETYLERLDAGVLGRKADATYPLWTLLNLEIWWRTFVDGEGALAGSYLT